MNRPCCRSGPPPRLRGLDALTGVYAALADPIRLRILALLEGGEICVCHIHDSLGVPQPTASRHLAYLRRAGLVGARRQGTWMHYRLTLPGDPVVAGVVTAALHALTHAQSSTRDRRRLEDSLRQTPTPVSDPGPATR
jgi:ArsR family transcriptional regulator